MTPRRDDLCIGLLAQKLIQNIQVTASFTEPISLIDNSFRSKLPKLVAPLILAFEKSGIHPNVLTCLSGGIAFFASYFVSIKMNLLALALWWLSRLFDGCDGILARQTKRTSAFGAYLDIVVDMFSYSIMIGGFMIANSNLVYHWVVILICYVLCISSALALGAFEQQANIPNRDNRGLRLGAGLAEGGETGIAYSLLLIFSQFTERLALLWIFVLVFTILSRTILASRILKF